MSTTNDPTQQFYEVSVAEVIDETHDARSFAFDIPDGLREMFAYDAGQFLTFEIEWGGMQLHRSYSLCSSESADELHRVAVKRVDDGRISNWFNDSVSVGDTLRVQPPAGRFVLDRDHDTAPLVLFGGGSGITPMLSLIKTAMHETSRNVSLIYANRDTESIIFRDELIELQAAFPRRLQITHHLDAVGGYLNADDVAPHISPEDSADYYVCGPSEFMDTVESALTEGGVERSHLHIERFVSPTDPDRREGSEITPEFDDDAGPAKLRLTLMGETHELEVEPGETILEAAHRQEVGAEYQCEEGYCGCCMAMLKEGDVDMPLYDALTDGEVEDGWILCCQARPTSEEVEVNYDETF